MPITAFRQDWIWAASRTMFGEGQSTEVRAATLDPYTKLGIRTDQVERTDQIDFCYYNSNPNPNPYPNPNEVIVAKIYLVRSFYIPEPIPTPN